MYDSKQKRELDEFSLLSGATDSNCLAIEPMLYEIDADPRSSNKSLSYRPNQH